MATPEPKLFTQRPHACTVKCLLKCLLWFTYGLLVCPCAADFLFALPKCGKEMKINEKQTKEPQIAIINDLNGFRQALYKFSAF